MDLHDTAAKQRMLLHFADVVGKEQHLRITDVGDQGEILTLIADAEACVGDIVLLDVAPRLQIGLPRRSERRIGKHEVKGLSGKPVVGDRRSEENIVGLVAFAFDQHIALCDRIRFVGVLLTVQMDGNALPVLFRDFVDPAFGDREHAAGSAGAVINAIGRALNLILDRNERKIGHKLNHIARREVASGIGNVRSSLNLRITSSKTVPIV